MKTYVKGANPYMPLWEHVPDGEPRVFEYNGEKRVYVYGSHDTMGDEYCGPDYVVWSAPVDDLTDWTCHGVCYEATDKSMLYAPDVVQKGDTFYMYAAEDHNSRIMVAKSKNPAGPFTDPVKTEVGCDVGVLVDDDGRVYAYWGFCACYCAELNEDMATIKEGTLREHVIGHCDSPWGQKDDFLNFEDGFYEAASPRKINGKYVLLYSKLYNTPAPEYGADCDCNGFLSYMYSDHPLERFVHGGDISLNGGEIITKEDGSGEMTFRWGNNHGGLACINDKWYIFYHRQTGLKEFARQAMMEPVDVAMSGDGRLFIGEITYENGEPVSSKAVEMTSQGPQINGIDARQIISAGYACHLAGGTAQTQILPVYEQREDISAPVVGVVNGVTAGYRYLQFGTNSPKRVTVRAKALADLTVNVRLDQHRGRVIASVPMKRGACEAAAALTCGVIGRHAVYFEFLSESEGEIVEFDWFTFE